MVGTLKIGDWGLTKYHSEATVLRGLKGFHTTTKYGTAMYEPPEVEFGEVKVLGRQYDVWSMGCIILEILIWLLYGCDGVHQFRADVKGRSADRAPCYEIMNSDADQPRAAIVRPIVAKWIDHIAKEPVCDDDTALGALLGLVKEGLLIVELPPKRGQTKHIKNWEPPSATLAPVSGIPMIVVTPAARGPSDSPKLRQIRRHRITSEELERRLNDDVWDDAERLEDYWFREVDRQPTMPTFATELTPTASPGGHRTGIQGQQFVSAKIPNCVSASPNLNCIGYQDRS